MLSTDTMPVEEPALARLAPRKRRGDGRQGSALFAHGEPMVWLSGGALAVCVVMIAVVLGLIIIRGSSTFWPVSIIHIEQVDGVQIMGEVDREETFDLTGVNFYNLPPKHRDAIRDQFTKGAPLPTGWRLMQDKFDALPDDAKKAVQPVAVAGGNRDEKWFDLSDEKYQALPVAVKTALKPALLDGKAIADMAIKANADLVVSAHRRLFRTGNFELTGDHFTWVNDFVIAKEDQPQWAVIFERETNGRFYGTIDSFLHLKPWTKEHKLDEFKASAPDTMVLVSTAGGKDHKLVKPGDVKAGEEIHFILERRIDGADAAWAQFTSLHPAVLERIEQQYDLKKHDLGRIGERTEHARLHTIDVKLSDGADSAQYKASLEEYEKIKAEGDLQSKEVLAAIENLARQNRGMGLWVTTADGRQKLIEMHEIVRAYPANQLGGGDKAAVYGSRWWEFLTANPREANSEGGVFPAIYGTVVMTLIMSFAVVPFGVIAALYLREYAKAGPIVSAVRIAVNNLAGVPSIVFGVFGLGFFCYTVGKYIDGGPAAINQEPMGSALWFSGVALWITFLAGGIFLGIQANAARTHGQGSKTTWLGRLSILCWCAAMVLAVILIIKVPFFQGFFRAKLEDSNKPTYGTGGLFCSSLTLALLTLPVVIVATEEALSAVPRSMREGSYACGASKWQTIKRIVLPRAMPGIMTGAILAMARGAGEVAPLMLVGVVKIAQELPIDQSFPYIHPERSFMHLGFHIYDVGFQSPNSKAAVPLVYTTTMLLILIIASLNILAIMIRTRLRRKFVSGHF